MGVAVTVGALIAVAVGVGVGVAVGGPPVMALSAVMPLPESLPELAFAGALGGRRVRLVRRAWVVATTCALSLQPLDSAPELESPNRRG